MKAEQKKLLLNWEDEIQKMYQAHAESSVKIRRMNYLLGIPIVVMAVLIGLYAFVPIGAYPEIWAKIGIGLLAFLTAIFAALQTFLKYSEQAENHRNASARYQSLLKEVEQLIAIPPKDEQVLNSTCNKMRVRWDELSLEAPNIPRRIEVRHELEKQVSVAGETRPEEHLNTGRVSKEEGEKEELKTSGSAQ
jgi:hypothetical protein